VSGRLRRAYRGMRLGTRLALGVGVLSLVVFAVVGAALTMYMGDYLRNQLDDQLKLVQVVQAKDAEANWTVQRQPYYRWYTAVYDVSHGRATLREPAELPKDAGALAVAAQEQPMSDTEHFLRTVHIDGEGTYRVRSCAMGPPGRFFIKLFCPLMMSSTKIATSSPGARRESSN